MIGGDRCRIRSRGRLEHLINWRLYHESSGWIDAELGSHHIDIANWVFDAIPQREPGSGICGITMGAGRTTTCKPCSSYPGGRRLIFTSITDNAKMGDELWIYGTEGIAEITLEDATFFYEPKKITTLVSGKAVGTQALRPPPPTVQRDALSRAG